MKQFVTDALQDKLAHGQLRGSPNNPGWMKYFGAFGKTALMRAETKRIQKLIDEEFETLNPEDEA